MTPEDTFGLPRDLGDSLTLRWATPDDAEAVAQFNLAMHSDPPGEEKFLYHRTHALLRGDGDALFIERTIEFLGRH